jgi:hypothetical protein
MAARASSMTAITRGTAVRKRIGVQPTDAARIFSYAKRFFRSGTPSA